MWMMKSSESQDKPPAGRGTNFAHAWPGDRSNAHDKKFPSDSMPGTRSEPAGIPNPTIRITGADGVYLREQSPENPHEVPGCEQSQGSYSILDSEDCRSVYTPSEDLDPTEEAYYHGLDKDGWHEGGQDALELKKSMEKSLEELALISSNRINVGGDINPAQVAPFRDENGGLPALRREETHNVTGDHGKVDLGRRVRHEGGLGQSSQLEVHITPSHEHPIGARGHPKEPLEDRLLDALQGDETTRGFFPVNSLSAIITESTVKEELQKLFPPVMKNWDDISKYAREICGTLSPTTPYRNIFAILVMVGKTPAIFKFLDEKVNDFDLPLKACYAPTSRHVISEFRRSREGYAEDRVECFREGWSKLDMTNFEEWQWKTLAPIFEQSDEEKRVSHYSSPTGKVTLPFIKTSRITGRRAEEFEGGGGRVSRVWIHPDHHSFHYKDCPRNGSATAPRKPSDTTTPSSGQDCECCYAIKQLHSTDAAFQQFKKEVDVLRRFSNEKHNHLISLLATYEHNGDFYLIFPWAQATLKNYWEEIHPNPSLDRQTIHWVAEQCKGIAYGVLAIHQYRSGKWNKLDPAAGQNIQFGHHGDIKPDNILWFQDSHDTDAGLRGFQRGTLKLTDFGLAAINTNRTVSRQFVGFPCSRDYSAPEADLMNCGPPGRQYDMWTLGCVYLEFVTWMIGGRSLVKEFTNVRRAADYQLLYATLGIKTATFFELQIDGCGIGQAGMRAKVKPQVTKFIERLHCEPRCTKFLHDFLDMIQYGLLIVRENGNNEFRYTSEQVHVKLTRMLESCKKSESYGCKPCPWQSTSNRK